MTTNLHPSTPPIDLHKPTLVSAMRQEYERLFGLFETVVEALEVDAAQDARCAFRAFEASFLKQLAFDGGLIVDASKTAQVRARALLEEHASLRRALLQLRIRLDLGILRAEATRRFVSELRGHVARKCSWLYSCLDAALGEYPPASERVTVPDSPRVRHASDESSLPTAALLC